MKEGSSKVQINGRVYDAKSGQVLDENNPRRSVISTRKVMDGVIKPSSPAYNPYQVRTTRSGQTAPLSGQMHAKKQKTSRLHPVIREAAKNKDAQARQFQKFTSSKKDSARQNRAGILAQSGLITRYNLGPTPESVEPPQQTVEDSIDPPVPLLIKRRFQDRQGPETVSTPVQTNDVADEKPPSWLKRNLLPAAASFAALALLSGFLVYNSLPGLSMRVAASRAGFDASIPAYQPAGYSFDGPIAYSPGRVIIRFDSNTDERFFTISQKTSDWDSQSLLSNFVAQQTENYLTFQEYGLTVYLYNGSQATWVDEGVWYHIDGTAELNSEQLLKIAASL